MPAQFRPLDRKEVLRVLEEERQLIIRRFEEHNKLAEPIGPRHRVRWYLDISKQWGVHVLQEMSRLPPGKLLDVGAYYGLIPGVALRLGWEVKVTDTIPLPEFSSLLAPGRRVESAIHNACTDPIPYPDESFDLVLLTEVLEHLMYSPLVLFRELRRVLKPGGVIFITTPNPGSLSKLVSLALGRNPLEPNVDLMLEEGRTYTHKGLTFFTNNRESKLWTSREIRYAVGKCELEAVDSYHYGNTVPLELMNSRQRIFAAINRMMFRFVRRCPLAGGSTFVKVRKPISSNQKAQ